MSEKAKVVREVGVLRRWSAPDAGDWRTFSVSRWSAARTVWSREAELREIACDSAPDPVMPQCIENARQKPRYT